MGERTMIDKLLEKLLDDPEEREKRRASMLRLAESVRKGPRPSIPQDERD